MVLSELEILMLLFIGWQAHRLYRNWHDQQQVKLIIQKIEIEEERLDQRITDEVNARLPICYVEKHKKADYCLYSRDTDQFICQGSSYEELAQLCKDRFDTVLVKAKDKSMWFVDGKVKELSSE